LPIRLLNVRETAKRLGVHENTIRNWESRGILRAIRLPVSGYRRFEVGEIDRMQHEMRSQFALPDEGQPTELSSPDKATIARGSPED
jgi:DNA-binding transcriptional MerR regulator